ncbi:Mce-associated membrane protein [Rhodococcus sp. 27YEA15]
MTTDDTTTGTSVSPAKPSEEETHTDDTSTVEPSSSSNDSTPTRRRVSTRFLPLLAGILVVLAALGWGGYTTWQSSLDDDARTSALDSGKKFATDLATYNFQNLDQNLSVVRDNSVGQFAGQYAQVASNLQNMIVQYQATSSAQILSAGLASADRDNAEVLVFLDQTITNTNSPDPRIDRNRMQLSLVREDGTWKLADVQLL